MWMTEAEQLLARIRALEEWLDRLVLPEVDPIHHSTIDISRPPTDAELDAAFGTPAEVGAGYMVIITDDGSPTGPWFLVVSDGTSWLYEELSKAA